MSIGPHAAAGSVEILSLAQCDAWEREQSAGALPTQCWSHAWALSAGGISPQLGVVSSGKARMLVPFFEREWHGTTDIATILGLWGTSFDGPETAIPELLSLWHAHARSRGWICGYLQLAPPIADPRLFGQELACNHNPMFLLDLGQDDLLASASTIVRRKVRRIERDGIELVLDRGELTNALLRLYPESHVRVGASSTYDFPAGALQRWMSDPANVAVGAAINGRVEAVSVFLACNQWAEYHINASSDHARGTAAWLIWQAMRILRDGGVSTLNLGGGVQRGDGLAQFKEKFGAGPTEVHSLRQIYDPVAYAGLSSEQAGGTSERFPAYRFGGS